MAPNTEKHPKSSSYISQKATVADLSVFEKLSTIPVLLTVVANAIISLLTGAFTPRSNRPASLYNHVALTAIRTLTSKATPRQQHYIIAPTSSAYTTFCTKHHHPPSSEILPDGTQAHWIGSPSSQNLILNFHGGGYVCPASPEMFEFMHQLVLHLTSQGKSVAVLMLSYDLAPGAQYPRQLQQAAALLTHVLTTLKYVPSSIVLTGDSAGANLALSLLSHITHPHPSRTLKIPPITLKEDFLGVVLISPWVSFDLSSPSWTANASKDCIDPNAGKAWSAAFLGDPHPHTRTSDYYNHPTTAPSSWWASLPTSSILIVAGADEVLLDGIVAFSKILTSALGSPRVEFLVAPGEYHDQAVMDLQFGYAEKDEGIQARKIKSWLSSKL